MAGITGYNNPKFDIYDGNNFIEQISLNLCDSEGFTETYDFISIKHDLIDYSELTNFIGYHINFTLSYSEYSDIQNSIKVKDLINHILKNHRIIIIPRSDIPFRYFEVNFTGDSFSLGILKGGMKAKGNKGIQLKFKTKYLLTDLEWINPEAVGIAKDDTAVLAA